MNDKLNKGTLIDGRTTEYFSGGHLSNAFNFPLAQVAQRINECKEIPKPIVADTQVTRKKLL